MQKILPAIAPHSPQGTWGGNIQMSAPVVDESETRGSSTNATFKAATNPYKSVIMEMQKIIEDNKPAKMELEKACPMIEIILVLICSWV